MAIQKPADRASRTSTPDPQSNFHYSLRMLPLPYLLCGAIPSILIVYEHLSLQNRWWFFMGLAGVVMLCVGGFLFRSGFWRIWLLIGGFAVFGLYTAILQTNDLHRRQFLTDQRVTLRGRLTSLNSFSMRELNGNTAHGKLYVREYEFPGDMEGTAGSLLVTGTIGWPDRSPSFADYLRSRNYLGILTVERIHSGLTKRGSNRFDRKDQDSMYRTLFDGSTRWPLSAALLKTLTVGDKATLPTQLERLFQELGMAHFFVISGLHVGILFAGSYVLFSWMTDRNAMVVSILIMTGYMFVLGWPASATRAWLMIGLGVVARLMSRRVSTAAILASAVFLMILYQPFLVVRPGFQLSVGALAGIAAVHSAGSSYAWNWHLRVILYNAGAFVGVTPVLLYHFHYLPIWGILMGWIGSYLFTPFLGLLFLQSGLMAIHWTVPADAFEKGIRWTFHKLSVLADQVPSTVQTGEVGGWTIAVLIGLLWVIFDPQIKHHHRFLAGMCCSLLFVLMVLPACPPHLQVGMFEDLPFTFLQSPDGTRVMILPPRQTLGEYEVVRLGRFLRRRGIQNLDYFISEYHGESIKRWNPSFQTDFFLEYSRSGVELQWKGGHFHSQGRELNSYFGSIRYNNPDFMENIPYRPLRLLGCTHNRTCFVPSMGQKGDLARSLRSRGWVAVELSREGWNWLKPGGGTEGMIKPRGVLIRLLDFWSR